MDIGSGELLVIAALVLLLLMPTKLPDLARSFGQAMHELRRARADEVPDGTPASAPAVDSSVDNSLVDEPN